MAADRVSVPYADNIFLNIITCVLIFFGGIGFLVIQELWQKKCQWKKLSMHTKVVLSVSLTLIIIGTLLIKLTEPVSWLCALFHSVSTRTAGFASRPIGDFGAPALLVMIVLMFIGASSGSTGGGIKTSTFFVLIRGIFSAATNQSEKAFHYSIPKDAFKKAAVISILSAGVVITSTYILMILEPQVDLLDALFEMTSAFSTAGLSTRYFIRSASSCQNTFNHDDVYRKTRTTDHCLFMVFFTWRTRTLSRWQYCCRITSDQYFNRQEIKMLNLKNNSYCSRNSKNKNMTYGIVGLGRFGSALAMDLASAGAEIVVMDKNEERVRTLREMTEHAYVVANLDKKTLIETGIQNCDAAIVCIAEHLDTSILTTLNLVSLGIPRVIAKAATAEHGIILEKLGAEVVFPERDMAIRLASRLENSHNLDIVQLSEQINISKTIVANEAIGLSVRDINLRERFGLNIIAIQSDDIVINLVTPDYRFKEGDILFVSGSKEGIFKLNQWLND